MKKITFMFLLLSSSFAFSQSVTWNNENLNLSPGETISMDLSYDITPGDLDYLAVQLRELDAGWNEVTSYTFNTVVDGSGANSGTNVLYNYTVDAGVPLSSELTSGHFYILLIFAQYQNGGTNWANDNTVITLEATLSNDDFNKSELQAFYNADRRAIVMKDQLNGGFSIYNLMGQEIMGGELSGEIGVESLKSGLYILSTKYGTLKFVK